MGKACRSGQLCGLVIAKDDGIGAVGVGGQEGETSSKTFHSFRYTVVEYLLKEARVPLNMVQTVVGHEITDMGVTEVYAGEWPMSVLLEEVIMKLRWHEWL